MNRRTFITASAVGLATGFLGKKLGAALIHTGLKPENFWAPGIPMSAIVDVIMQEGPSPNRELIWPAQVLRDAVKALGTPLNTCPQLYCVDSAESIRGGNQVILFPRRINCADIVAEVDDLYIVEDPCRVVCKVKWIKTSKSEAALKKVCTGEFRLCAAGKGSASWTAGRGGNWQIVDDGFSLIGLYCGKRRAFPGD